MFFKSDKEVNSRGKCFRPEGTHAEASRKERAPYVQNSKRWDKHREMYTQMRVCTKQTYCTHTDKGTERSHKVRDAGTWVDEHMRTHIYVNTQSSTREYTEPRTSGLPW